MSELKRVEVDGEGSHKTRLGRAAARPGLNAAGDPEDDEEEEKKKPEEDEEDEENDGEEEEVPWQVAGPHRRIYAQVTSHSWKLPCKIARSINSRKRSRS
jgi:hypothetical protein